MKITINNKDYEARYSLKAQMLWEKSYEKPFAPSDLNEIWGYYYFILTACNDGFEDEVTFEDLLKYASEDASIGEALLRVATSNSSKKKVMPKVLVWLFRRSSRF